MASRGIKGAARATTSVVGPGCRAFPAAFRSTPLGWAADSGARHHMPASRQPHRELGEAADFAIDGDRAAVLLDYDLLAYRQAGPRTFAGRLGCEERLE